MPLSEKTDVQRARRKVLFKGASVVKNDHYSKVWANVRYDPRLSSREYQILADIEFGAALGGEVDWSKSDSGVVSVTVYYD